MLGGEWRDCVVDVSKEFVDKLSDRVAGAVQALRNGGECLLAENCTRIVSEEPRTGWLSSTSLGLSGIP